MAELFGIISGILLALSGIPQAIHCYKTGSADGVTLKLISLLMSGIGFLAIYVYLKHGFDPILHGEHAITLSVWLVVLRYKLWPRRAVTQQMSQNQCDNCPCLACMDLKK
jgi:uncharacterized protein with PQ loop repeat